MNVEQMNRERRMSKLKRRFPIMFNVPVFDINFVFLLHHSKFRVHLFIIHLVHGGYRNIPAKTLFQ